MSRGKQPTEPGVHRQPRQSSSELRNRGDPTRCADRSGPWYRRHRQGTEPQQQLLRRFYRGGQRRIEEAQGLDTQPRSVQGEQQLGQVQAAHFRQLELRAQIVIVTGVQPNAPTGLRASRPSGALGRRSATDRLHPQRRQPRPVSVSGDARQATIDHRGDAVDGHRGLGDVGRQDNFAAVPRLARGDGAALLDQGQIAVQRQYMQPELTRELGQIFLAAADLRPTRQKHQDVAAAAARLRISRLGAQELAQRLADLLAQLLVARLGQVLHADVEAPPLAAHRWTVVEERRNLGGRQGR